MRIIPSMAWKLHTTFCVHAGFYSLKNSEQQFEYLPGQKNKNAVTVADTLSHLDIDSLKIQEKQVLTLLSGSEKAASVISNEQSQCILPWSLKKKQKPKNYLEKRV
jgi:hypothetical protein